MQIRSSLKPPTSSNDDRLLDTQSMGDSGASTSGSTVRRRCVATGDLRSHEIKKGQAESPDVSGKSKPLPPLSPVLPQQQKFICFNHLPSEIKLLILSKLDMKTFLSWPKTSGFLYGCQKVIKKTMLEKIAKNYFNDHGVYDISRLIELNKGSYLFSTMEKRLTGRLKPLRALLGENVPLFTEVLFLYLFRSGDIVPDRILDRWIPENEKPFGLPLVYARLNNENFFITGHSAATIRLWSPKDWLFFPPLTLRRFKFSGYFERSGFAAYERELMSVKKMIKRGGGDIVLWNGVFVDIVEYGDVASPLAIWNQKNQSVFNNYELTLQGGDYDGKLVYSGNLRLKNISDCGFLILYIKDKKKILIIDPQFYSSCNYKIIADIQGEFDDGSTATTLSNGLVVLTLSPEPGGPVSEFFCGVGAFGKGLVIWNNDEKRCIYEQRLDKLVHPIVVLPGNRIVVGNRGSEILKILDFNDPENPLEKTLDIGGPVNHLMPLADGGLVSITEKGELKGWSLDNFQWKHCSSTYRVVQGDENKKITLVPGTQDEPLFAQIVEGEGPKTYFEVWDVFGKTSAVKDQIETNPYTVDWDLVYCDGGSIYSRARERLGSLFAGIGGMMWSE